MHKLMLDTSSIIFAFSNRKDIFESAEEQLHAEVVVSSGVVRELERIASRRTKEGRAARVALEVMKKHTIEVVKDDGSVDEWILESGSVGSAYVCTNDIKLKLALKDRGRRALSVSENGVLR